MSSSPVSSTLLTPSSSRSQRIRKPVALYGKWIDSDEIDHSDDEDEERDYDEDEDDESYGHKAEGKGEEVEEADDDDDVSAGEKDEDDEEKVSTLLYYRPSLTTFRRCVKHAHGSSSCSRSSDMWLTI